MLRKLEDSADARQALENWLTQKPHASIVVAAIEEMADGALEVSMRLSALTGYHLIGLMQALLQQTLRAVEETPGAELSPEYEMLLEIQRLLDAGPVRAE